jgi:2-deoxy-D-gluconate 3-dehydrogenase
VSIPFDLHGKTAAVTGGGRGLGLGISSALLEAGADVIIFGRNPVVAELNARAEALGRQVHCVKLDLADSEAIASAAQLVLSTHQVDILVNNAGTQDRYPALDFPLQAWDRVLDINLRAVFQLCQLFGAPMLDRGEGKIVNLASLLSFQGGLTVPAYAASKGAVAQLTKALCNEWAGRGVNVNAVAPGYMATDMNSALLADPERMEQLSTRIPAGRYRQRRGLPRLPRRRVRPWPGTRGRRRVDGPLSAPPPPQTDLNLPSTETDPS